MCSFFKSSTIKGKKQLIIGKMVYDVNFHPISTNSQKFVYASVKSTVEARPSHRSEKKTHLVSIGQISDKAVLRVRIFFQLFLIEFAVI